MKYAVLFFLFLLGYTLIYVGVSKVSTGLTVSYSGS